jgi:hypothetical protein
MVGSKPPGPDAVLAGLRLGGGGKRFYVRNESRARGLG